MFYIMQKKGAFIKNVKKYGSNAPVRKKKSSTAKQEARFETIEEARDFVAGTNLYIEYSNSEIAKEG